MSSFLHPSIILLAATVATTVQAQLPIVDISSVTTINDQVEIRVRPDASFSGLFAAMVFTLRWTNADGANLGTIQQDVSVIPYMSVSKSGAEQTSGPYRYQVFAGFGNQPLSNVGASWIPMEEVVICRVNIINGSSVFEIVEDAFTGANNGNYYISLNGQDRTGEIYTFTTHIPEETSSFSDLVLLPNPTKGELQMSLTDPLDGPVSVELFDLSGRLVWTKVLAPDRGKLRTMIDMRGLADGVFLLKVSGYSGSMTQRVVLAAH